MASPVRPTPAGSRDGNGGSDGNGRAPATPASKLAVQRTRKRDRDANGKRGGGVLVPLLVTLSIVALVITGTAVLVAGGSAAAMLAALEKDLPDVMQFETLEYAEPTRVYDRDGKTLLATFFAEKREVVGYKEIPRFVLDVTTSVEDRTFWENEGVDLQATLAGLTDSLIGNADRGGGSTITQQFVRARLLPKDLVSDPDRLYERKAKEIIQSYKLTQAFPGEPGKERIITAYLNQIFYGHNAYGIKAAAEVYFGKQLRCTEAQKANKKSPCEELTIAEAALLAGIPQSPSVLDPYRYAKTVKVRNKKGKLVTQLQVPSCGAKAPATCIDPAPVVRRNYILRSLAENGRWTKLTTAQLEEALDEPIVLRGDKPVVWQAPHFVWRMREQLDQLLADRLPAEEGGYTVISTIDARAQRLAEKYVKAATIFTQYGFTAYLRALREYHVPYTDRTWLDNLRGRQVRNASMVVLDYRTGDILAYVGSANYYGKNSRKMDPKYDVAGVGYRQSGSAWKPIVYATAIEEKVMTAGSVILDVTTPFQGRWVPTNAALNERGPILARKALQYSLNIPAIRVMDKVGARTVGQYSAKAGITFLAGRKHMEMAGLAGAIGTVEVHPLDLTAAYGAFGNGGMVSSPRYILQVKDADGKTIFKAGKAEERRFVSAQTAFIMADILKGNTNPSVNVMWGPKFQLNNGPGGSYRVAALKTGTTNDFKDYGAYGLLPQPTSGKAPGLAVGVWMGNSDHSMPNIGSNPLYASDGPAQVWHSFLRDYMAGEPAPDFQPPSKGLARVTIDAYSGGQPGPWTRQTVQEWFINGTQPGSKGAIDKDGLIYVQGCGTWMVDPLKAENKGAPSTWKTAVRDWIARARRGPGVASRSYGTITTYGEWKSSWGGPIVGPCPTAKPTPEPGASLEPGESPVPTANPDRTPKPTPRPTPRPARPAAGATPEPQPTPRP